VTSRLLKIPESELSSLFQEQVGSSGLCHYVEQAIKTTLESVGCLGKVDFLVQSVVCKPSSITDSYLLTFNIKFHKMEELSSSVFMEEQIPSAHDKWYDRLTTNYEISNTAIMYDKNRLMQMAIEEMYKHAADELLKSCGTSFKEEYKNYHEKLHEKMSLANVSNWEGIDRSVDIKCFTENWVPPQPSVVKHIQEKWLRKANRKEQRKKKAPWGYE
jgi:hypothetical protein